MKRFSFYILACFVVAGIGLHTVYVNAQQPNIVYFEKSGEVVLNPGQGWILYGMPTDQTAATIALGTTGYQTFDWAEVNPQEDVYNWTNIDDHINRWAAQGKQFAFGIMNVNTFTRLGAGGLYRAFPQWLLDKGMKYTMGNGESSSNRVYYIPVWDDPVYVAACSKFAAALATKYDGNPNVAFIDIRNYGNWGEMHMYPFNQYTKALTAAQVQSLLIQPYIDRFKETQLGICWGEPPLNNSINDWVVDHGIALRLDGVMGNMQLTGNSGDGDVVAMAIGKEPIIWEFLYNFREFERNSVVPWNDSRFINIIKANKPSYISFGKWDGDAQYMLSKKPQLVREVANLMGFNFSMTSAVYTNVMAAGEAKEITVFIENTGVTTMLTDCVIKFVLLNEKDEVVSSFKTNWDAKKFKASETTELKANLSFAGTPAGTYKLAIGLYLRENDQMPTYKMENKVSTKKGFYVIGDLKVTDQCKIGEYIEAAVGETNLCSGTSLLYNIPESVSINDIDAVIWKTNPSNAGIIKSVSGTKGSAATVEWDPNFRPSLVEIMYSVQMSDGSNCISKPLIVNLESENILPPVPEGPVEITDEPTTIYTAEQDWNGYEWQISPITAGAITTDANKATIHWTGGSEHSHVGKVQVSYRVTKTNNICGISEFSPALSIDLLPKPPTPLDNDPCAGTNTVFETRLYANASSYQWNIDPTDAGTIISKANTATINWLPSFLGQASVSYSVSDAERRTYTSESVSVNIHALPARPDIASALAPVDWNISESILTADPDGDRYDWQIVPATAGTITTDGNLATIHWTGGNEHSYAGQVKVSYRMTHADNNCGFSEFSLDRYIDLLPKPPTPSDINPCAGTNTVFETWFYTNASSYQWHIDPMEAGAITSQANTATIDWMPSFSGLVNVSYSIMDAGHLYTSEPVTVNIHALPARPDIASGLSPVDWNISESILTADPGGNRYDWQISPETAGTIVSDGNLATIHWAGGNEHSYAGQVKVSYRITHAGNDCGFSEFSPVLAIDLLPKPPTPVDIDPCAGTNTAFEALLYEDVSYQWHIEPMDAGTFTSQANTATIDWSSSFKGQVDVFYSVMDAAGHSYTSESVPVNILALPARPNTANGQTPVDWNISESILTADPGGDRYDWQISPATAGTIVSDGNLATIHWAGGNEHSYAGQVEVSYRITNAGNDCGFSEFSPDMSIDLLPKPPTPADIDPCAGTSTAFEALLYEDMSYQWHIEPMEAGTATSQTNTATINWSTSFLGRANVFYSVMDATGHSYTSESVPVNIHATPARPNIARGQTSVEWNVPESTFTADLGGYSYDWQISPATAGTITTDGNTATIHWAGGNEHSYAGQVEVSYRIMNTWDDCGFSEFSPALTVKLLPRPPVTSDYTICAGNYSIFNTQFYANALLYHWDIYPALAGTITMRANTATIVWAQDFSGKASVSYSVTDVSGSISTSLQVLVTVEPLPAIPGIAMGPSSVNWDEITSNFAVSAPATTDDQGYQWSLNPVAGTISLPANTSPVTITWDHLYVGTVQITYKAHNNCGWSAPSPDRLVVLQPIPPETSDKEPCSGTSSTVSAPNYKNAKGYSWKLEPATAGTITNQANTATINWSKTFSGRASVSYSVTNTMGEADTSEPVQVAVKPLPAIPGIATGPSSVNWNEAVSDFSVATQATTDDQGYQWSLNPAAGTISSSGNTSQVTVTWDHLYVGTVPITYQAHNSCGWSASSPSLPVVLQPAPPEISNKEPCSGSRSTASAPNYKNAKGYSWSLVPANAGTITNQANTAIINWSKTFSGSATVSYLVKGDADVFYTSSPVQVILQPLPVAPEMARGPSSVRWDEMTSKFSVAAQATTDSQGYLWSLDPQAGTFSSSGNTSQVTVTWDHLYVGTVPITYQTHNSCGWSVSSPALSVVLQPIPPVISSKEPCSSSRSTVSAPNYKNAKGYSWSLVPANAGTITNQANTAIIDWSKTFSGSASVSYSVTGNAGGIYTSSKIQVSVQPLPATPEMARGTLSVSWDETASTFSVAAQATTDDQGYQWTLNPTAGTISPSGNASQITVTWDHLYAGTVPITYQAHNSCGWSASSTPLVVVLQPAPPDISSKEPCSGSCSTVSAPNYKNTKGYSWSLVPANAGTITNQANMATINWSKTFSGQVSISYSVTDAAGGIYISSKTQATVQPLPDTPGKPTGSSYVRWDETVSAFSIAAQATTDDQGYQWSLNPAAGTFSSSGNTSPVSVTWDHLYVGIVQITYKAHNHCGWSAASPALPVVLHPTPPEVSQKEPCGGTSSTVSAPNYKNAKGYSWKLAPANAGTISDGGGNVVNISWDPLFDGGLVTIEYTVTVGTERYSASTQVNLRPLPVNLPQASGNTTVAYSESATVYTAPNGWGEYRWEISPAVASDGIQVDGSRLSASWNKKYVGEVNISYKVRNNCGWSFNSSQALVVTLQPASPAIDPSEACNDSETVLSAPLYQNASVYQWHISPSDAGEIVNSGHQTVIRWNNLYTGEAAISYTILTSTGESYSSSQVLAVVKGVMAKPSIASGPNKVYLNQPHTTYQATPAGIQYEWTVTPSQAAKIQNPTSETPSILWNPVYYGEAKLEYRIWNVCGWSEMSDPLVVQIYQSVLPEDIPGILTPNGDGFNDTWNIPAINQYPEAIIRIYNRAKKLMVEFKGAQLPWDGRDRNGNMLESGYYLYQIELKKGDKVVSGYVTILR